MRPTSPTLSSGPSPPLSPATLTPLPCCPQPSSLWQCSLESCEELPLFTPEASASHLASMASPRLQQKDLKPGFSHSLQQEPEPCDGMDDGMDASWLTTQKDWIPGLVDDDLCPFPFLQQTRSFGASSRAPGSPLAQKQPPAKKCSFSRTASVPRTRWGATPLQDFDPAPQQRR
jgi:hypothetical protein